MSRNSERFDHWIRSDFAAINTELEDRYFRQDDRAQVENVGDDLKKQLLEDGRSHIGNLLKEGNTDEGFDNGFALLGNVGLYMAACERHAITRAHRENRSPLHEASALALQLGATLGVIPRFATSHLATHSRAIAGRYRTFTTLEDEYVFLEDNTRGVLAYKRAADALLRILPLGVSHPVTGDLLQTALNALDDVIRHNDSLYQRLDIDRFFYSVRPYYKPHRVGLHVYRGANAGDFAGINVIDLLLGLCNAGDAFYSQLLVDKVLYMMPEDQAVLRDCMRRHSLMDEFLQLVDSHPGENWYHSSLELFIRVCERHRDTARQHHEQLVSRFIEKPAAGVQEQHHENLTASGPPLPVLLKSLEKLRDLRMAADRSDIRTRYHDLQKLRSSLS